MSRKYSVLLLVILLVSLSIPIFPIESQDGPVPPDPIDLVLTDPLSKVNPVFARGVDYSITAQPDGGYVWSSAPVYIHDGSQYVPYIYEETANYYQVQAGLIGARIHKSGYAEFLDPEMTEVRLHEERWEVQYWSGKKWSVCVAYDPIFEVFEDGTTITITASFITGWPNAGERALHIKYIFREGQPLKHEILFTSHSTETYEFRIIQKWAGIVADKVNGKNGNMRQIFNNTQFKFTKTDGSLSIYENQWAMVDYLDPVEVDTHANGLKADYVFSNWTLAKGEYLEIDPDTQTSENPTVDGYVFEAPTPAYRTGEIDLRLWHNNFDRSYRSLWRWDISSINDGATITNATLEFNLYFAAGTTDDIYFKTMFADGANWNNDPQTLLNAIANGDVCAIVAPNGVQAWYTAVFNQTGLDQIEYELTDEEQFQFGAMLESEEPTLSQLYSIYSEEEGAPNMPRCNITYYVAPSTTSATITDMDDINNCYTMKKYYTFVIVVEATKGADTITDVYLQGRQGANVRFEVRATNLNVTPAYGIESGAAVIDLDTISCSWGEAGDVGTATFTIRFEWDYAQEDDGDLAVNVADEDGNSTGFTVVQTDYFDVISRLTTTGFEANRNYVVRGGSVTLFGYVKYATTATGNVSSTSYPPDSLFTAVHIHNSVDVSQGSDTTIVDGYFRVTFNIPDAIQANSYHVYLDMTG